VLEAATARQLGRRPREGRLRVLQICEAASAGVGRHTIDLVRGLTAADCDVHLLYARGRIDAAFERGLRDIPGLRSAVVPMTREPGFHDAAAVSRVKRYLREHGPFDVIHGQSSKGGAMARLAGAMTGSAVVYTPHCIFTMAPGMDRVRRSVYGFAEQVLASLTDCILAASREEYDHIRELGIAEERLRLVLHGLEPPPPTSREALRAELGLAPNTVVVGFVGRLCAQKNPALALRAFAELARGRSNVRLAVVGRGELEQECAALARALGVAEQVLWLGYRSGYEAMLAFDVLLLSSAYEGLPYVMLERLFAGLPLVTTPVGGVSVAVADGVDGLITPHDDAAAMARALAKLVDEPALRAAFGAAALERSGKFALGSMVERVLAIYEECRGAQRAAARGARSGRGSVAPRPWAPAFKLGLPR
jgi:glycosyltransferase involved in cell wall biosynthesis